MNLLDRVAHEKLKYASMEARAVARYPLTFLPEDYESKIESLKKLFLQNFYVIGW